MMREMTRVRVLALVCLSIPVILPFPAEAALNQRAMSLTLWDENVNRTELEQTLDNMAAIGVDHVGVNVWWFQENISSTTIAPDFSKYSASDASVASVIDTIHAHGMKVMLKPLVDLSNDPDHWRGQIVGGDTWFNGTEGYGNFITHFADIAELHNVEIFCVGTELAATTGQENNWRNLITEVKNRFSGELTYAAQHGGSGGVTAANIGWWDALDYFGINAYYPLTNENAPTLDELQAAWKNKADQIASWRDSIDPTKPVIFTEVGYRSWDGTNKHPWSCSDWGSSNVDQEEQADCYEALLSQLWDEDWLAGIYWWNWEVDPDPSDWLAPNWFSPQGKLAETVLANYYIPEPASLVLLALGGLSVLARRRRQKA